MLGDIYPDIGSVDGVPPEGDRSPGSLSVGAFPICSRPWMCVLTSPIGRAGVTGSADMSAPARWSG